MRIASLLASGTELVCALGAGEELVARSHECDWPPWVTRLPVVSQPTFAVDGVSGEIDRLVRGKLRAGEPLYRIDEERLAALAPDVVITQTHCEVCAVTSRWEPWEGSQTLPRRSAPGKAGRSPRDAIKQVSSLRAGTLQGILDGFLDVAQVIGREAEGGTLIGELRATMRRWEDSGAGAARRPTIVCLEWIDPPFAMGNWGPELVRLAGGEDLLGTAGAHSTATPWETVRAADPDVLLVAPCGFGVERALAEMPTLEAQPGWRDLRAVRTGKVVVADGNRFFNRSGPGVFETIEILAEVLHPARFPPRHEGRAWKRR